MAKSQIFFWLLVSFIFGIAAVSFLPFSIPVVWAVFSLGGVLACFGSLQDGRARLGVAGVCAMVGAAGMLWFLRESRLPPSPLAAAVGKEVSIEARITDEPVTGRKSQRLVVRREGERPKILAVTRPFPEYRYGDVVRLRGRIERPENFSEDFDYVSYLAKDDIVFSMAFPETEIIARDRGSPVYTFLFGLKRAFAEGLERSLPEPHSAFMSGLLLGERSAFPDALTESLRVTGTSHIVALSGYNIGIVASALMSALMFVFVPFAWAFWLATAGIVAFTMLTGAAASVVRASVMGILVLIARREGRRYRVRNALAFAAVIMLIANPKILRFDVGFQLSFLATLGLVYLAPLVEQAYERAKLRMFPVVRDVGLIRDSWNRKRRRKRPFLREVFLATMSAQLAVLPLIVYQFGTLSVISPIANLAVIPLIPATMGFGFFTGGVALASDFLARVPAAVSSILLGYELGAIEFFSQLPLASLEVRGFGIGVFMGGYGLLGWWLWKRRGTNTQIPRQ